jgi:pimeloyl-ACP methyl ester carboxylesterase
VAELDVTMAEEPRILRLRDGRALAYAEHGEPAGFPVLFFHGLPGSRLMHPDAEASRAAGVRLVVADRPGFGRSDPRPGRALLDWADDVAELADALGLGRFAVAGASGGAPFALACAHRLRARVTAVAVLGGVGPVDAPGALDGIALERRLGFLLARRAPALFAAVMRRRGDPRRDPDRFFVRYTRHNPPVDQALLAQPEIRAMFVASYLEATRLGVEAFAGEVRLLVQPWGFRLEEIGAPVMLWHGAEDNSTPVGMARAMARALPRSTLNVLPGEGHLFFLPRWRQIATALVTAAG